MESPTMRGWDKVQTYKFIALIMALTLTYALISENLSFDLPNI